MENRRFISRKIYGKINTAYYGKISTTEPWNRNGGQNYGTSELICSRGNGKAEGRECTVPECGEQYERYLTADQAEDLRRGTVTLRDRDHLLGLKSDTGEYFHGGHRRVVYDSCGR